MLAMSSATSRNKINARMQAPRLFHTQPITEATSAKQTCHPILSLTAFLGSNDCRLTRLQRLQLSKNLLGEKEETAKDDGDGFASV